MYGENPTYRFTNLVKNGESDSIGMMKKVVDYSALIAIFGPYEH